MNSAFVILSLLTLLSGACSRPENTVTPTCTRYTTDKEQAQQWIVGRWKLVKVIADIPNPPVPNVVLTIDNGGQIDVAQDGKPIGQIQYEIYTDPANTLRLKTTTQLPPDPLYLPNPALQVCPDRLFLDAGIALDLPSYEFHRLAR